MSRIDTGSVTVGGSGTAVQISTSIATSARVRATDVIFAIEITPRSTNSGVAMYFGSSVVSPTYGSRILKGVSKSFVLEPGGDKFSFFYMDADNGGDIADWVVVF